MTQPHPEIQSSRWSPAFSATLLTLLCLSLMAPVAALVWSAMVPSSPALYWSSGWPDAWKLIPTRPLRVVLTGFPLALSLLIGVLIYRLRVAQCRLEHHKVTPAAPAARPSEQPVTRGADDPAVPATPPEQSTSPEPPLPTSAVAASSPPADQPIDSGPADGRFTSATRIGAPTATDEAQDSAEMSADTSRFDAPTRRNPVSNSLLQPDSSPDGAPATSPEGDANAGRSGKPRFKAPTRKDSAPRFHAPTRQADNASYDVIQRLTTLPDDTSQRGADDARKADQTTEDTDGD